MRQFLLVLPDALQGAQVDQDVDQRVLVGDGALAAQVRALDAEGQGLAVDAFVGGALVVDGLVLRRSPGRVGSGGGRRRRSASWPCSRPWASCSWLTGQAASGVGWGWRSGQTYLPRSWVTRVVVRSVKANLSGIG